MLAIRVPGSGLFPSFPSLSRRQADRVHLDDHLHGGPPGDPDPAQLRRRHLRRHLLRLGQLRR